MEERSYTLKGAVPTAKGLWRFHSGQLLGILVFGGVVHTRVIVIHNSTKGLKSHWMRLLNMTSRRRQCKTEVGRPNGAGSTVQG